jgi:hypothetical protein
VVERAQHHETRHETDLHEQRVTVRSAEQSRDRLHLDDRAREAGDDHRPQHGRGYPDERGDGGGAHRPVGIAQPDEKPEQGRDR